MSLAQLVLPAAARILIVRRDNIGDLLCTTPLIRALRAALPQAHLAVLTNDYAAPILAGNPDLDAIHAYSKAKHRPDEWPLALYWRRWRLRRQLRAQRFDLIILAGSAFSARALAHAQAIEPRQILGYAPDRGSAPAALDWPLPPPERPCHHVEAVFGLLSPLGLSGPPPAMRLVAPADEVSKLAERLRREAGFAAGRLTLGVHLSARKPSQRWPVEHFHALLRAIAAEWPVQFLLLWAPGAAHDARHPGDDDKAAQLSAVLTGLTFHAQPTHKLHELTAATALCDAFICADGGAMHIAAALGKPIVCLFGDSDAGQWHPWGVTYELLQRSHVAEITPFDALAAWRRLMARSHEPASVTPKSAALTLARNNPAQA